MMLTWRTIKQHRPYGPKYVAFLGAIPVASVEDQGDDFDLHFSLPPKCWRGDHDDLYLTGHRCSYQRLPRAKSAAERIVRKWLADAGLHAH